ncbi:hypothetical protein ACFX13_018561 [Malus domestica]
MASSDSTIYTCTECRANLNLTAANLYPPDFFFEAGNKGTVSFAAVDATKFRFDKEDKIRPFFETRNYWGIQWTRTKIKGVFRRYEGRIRDLVPEHRIAVIQEAMVQPLRYRQHALVDVAPDDDANITDVLLARRLMFLGFFFCEEGR